MKLKTTAVFAVIALMLTAGAAAAMPGSAPDHAADGENEMPDDQPPEQADANASAADSHADENESADADDADNASERRDGAAAGERGPPQDMPEQVPDHVSSIHDLIRTFLHGDGDGNLGEQISDVTPDDEEADGNATASPDATATPTA